MRNSRWFLLLSVLVILLLVAACGGSEATQAPEPAQPTESQPDVAPQPTDTTAPTEAPPPTEAPVPTDTLEPEPAGDVELDIADLGEPLNLSSYRSVMSIVVKGVVDDQDIEESIDFVIEYTSEPLAQHISMSGQGFEGTEEGMNAIEMYLVEDTMYMKMGEEWLSMPATEGETLSEGMITPGNIVEDTCGWKNKGKTEIDGVKVQHWTISKEDMEKCTPAEQMLEMGNLTDAGGDLYIAEDGNYVVQMDMFFEGNDLDLSIESTDEALQQGRMEIHFKLTDVNQPISIVLPEEATASGALPEDIPIPADAEEITNMFGMINFYSASTPQEVSDFYKAAMPDNGWTEVSADEFSGMFMLEYSKDSRTASLMINTDEDKNMTSVLITIEDGE